MTLIVKKLFIFLFQSRLPREALWFKNNENQNNRKSHTWAPLKGTSRFQFLNNLKSKIQIWIILIEKVIFFFCLIPELVERSIENLANGLNDSNNAEILVTDVCYMYV